VAGLFESDKLVARGDGGERGLHFGDGAERVAGPMEKQRGCPQLIEMLRAELVRLARRMERVGEEQKRVGDAGCFGGENTRLAGAVGMTSEDNGPGHDFAHGFDGALQAFAIALRRATMRRAGRALLAIGKIAAQDVKASGGEGFGNGKQERRIAIGASAVGDDEGFLRRLARFVEPATNEFALKMFRN
jgi:hypothetical protein